MNINKYWIGYLTGILIILHIFSVGVILSYTLSLNWVVFFWIWLVITPILMMINYLYKKEREEVKKYGYRKT